MEEGKQKFFKLSALDNKRRDCEMSCHLFSYCAYIHKSFLRPEVGARERYAAQQHRHQESRKSLRKEIESETRGRKKKSKCKINTFDKSQTDETCENTFCYDIMFQASRFYFIVSPNRNREAFCVSTPGAIVNI